MPQPAVEVPQDSITIGPAPSKVVEKESPKPLFVPPAAVPAGPSGLLNLSSPQGLLNLSTSGSGALSMEFAELGPAPEMTIKILGQVQGLSADDKRVEADMHRREMNYLERFPYTEPDVNSVQLNQNLRQRYNDSRVTPDQVHEIGHLFAQERGIDLVSVPTELRELPFDGGSLGKIKEHVHRLAEAFFDNPRASQNPEKCATVKAETDRFLELLLQARAEGDPQLTSQDLSCTEVYKLVSGNVGALALQDRAASEAAIGDHGVRHLVGHNIRVCETMADEIQKNGGVVTAKDRLILHQAMILHDMGYSTQNVRESINQIGVQGQDFGHPVLGGRYLRERFQNTEDPMRRVFSGDDVALMHRCMIYHDMDEFGKAGLDFSLAPQPTAEQRANNLESMTRLADNTHAFEDKLPEFIYANPQTLVSMRLMGAASELGEADTMAHLKGRLKNQLNAREDLSKDDRKAMGLAVDTMLPVDIDYAMRRILGNEPAYALDAKGKVHLTLQESAVHRDVCQLSGEDRYRLLKNWIKDLSGLKLTSIDPTKRVIDSEKVTFTVDLNGRRSREMTPFQEDLSKAFIENKPFSRWAVRDTGLAKQAHAVDQFLKASSLLGPDDLRQAASTFIEVGPRQNQAEIMAALRERQSELKQQRHDLLHSFLDSGH